MKRVHGSLGFLALCWLIGSCGGDGPTAPPTPTTAVVVLSATTGTIVPAATIQFSATAKDQSGQPLPRSFAWSSSDVAKATVSSSGMVSGVAAGTATITAAVDGKSATATVTVLDGGVVSNTGGTLNVLSGQVQIVVPADALASPTNLSVVPSTAYANDPRVVKDTPFDFGPTGTQFAKPVSIRIKYAPANLPQGTEEAALQLHLSTSSGWLPIAGSVVDLSAHTVTAEVSHFSVYAILTPLPVAAVTIRSPPGKPPVVVGDTMQLAAVLTDVQGDTLSNRAIIWETSNGAIASVSPGGLATGLAAGTTTISATAGGVTSSIAVTVTPIPVAAVAVTLTPPAVQVGQTSQGNAALTDAAGHALTGRTVAWSSDNSAVATVSASGAVTALAPGTAQITATSEGKTGSAVITVSSVPVASVAVTPATSSVVSGATQQLVAETKDANGSVLTGRVITWSSSNTAAATVSATGVVTAVAAGTATITATSEGKAGTATITVSPVPVATLTLSGSTTPVVLGQTVQLIAAPKDGGGNILAGRTVTWVSSNTAVLTVSAASTVSSSTGATVTVTATGLGTAIVTANSESAPSAATSVITVNPVPVATVAVSPLSSTLVLGLTPTQQLTATLKDVNNTVLTGRTVTWSSSNPAAATVDGNGFVTAVAVGNTTITATSEGQNGTSSITVSLAPVATVTVSAPTTPMIQGQTQQLTATTKDANGNVLTGRTITWVSSNTAVLTVSAGGSPATVTAAGVGTATITATSESVSSSPTPTITVNPIPVATVTVSPASATLVLGITPTQQLTAVTKDANGNTLTGRTVTWASSNSAAATVNTTGLVTAVGAGSTTITATSEGQNGTSSVTVSLAPVATVTVSAPTTPMIVGGTQQLTATTNDANGNVLTGRAITWVSSNTAVLTVSASGSPATVTAVGVGTATVTATSESVSSSPTATITVNPVPVATVTVALSPSSITAVGTSQASATTFDSNGNTLTGRVVTWSSDNTAIATVSAQGVVSGVAVGTANITATSEGKTGSATITVTQAPVASVSVSLASSPIQVGQTTQATATTRDAGNNVLTGRAITWSSDNTSIATVSGTGVVTALTTGSANITATSEGKNGSASLTVVPVPVASVTLSAPITPMTVGGTQQLTATTKDSNGNMLTGRAITWVSSNTAVLTVSASGNPATVTAVGGGSATISATSETITGITSITVTPPVATVTVSPSSATLTVGLTHQLTATLTDINNNNLTGRVVTWSSSDPTRASVSSSGLVTAVAAGPATITATSEGKSGTSSITVTPIPVASVTVSLATAIQIGQTTQATATTFDASNNVLTERVVTWSSGNTAVATVSSAGLVTAVAAGSTTITATSEGQAGNASLTVNPVPVGSVTVSPATATVTAGATQQLSAETRDANNVVVTDRVVTWSSSNTSVATVNGTGLLTAVSVGGATITASSEGKSGTSSITVIPVPVASVTVALSPNSITAVGTSQATATTFDGNGGVLTGRAVAWSSSNTTVATVSSAGVVTAVAVGTATITATSEGQSGGATLTVTPAPVASVTLSPTTATIVQGGTEPLSVTLKDAHNNVLTGRVVTWSSSDATVASVSQSGLVTAVSPGSVTITATSEGQSATASVTVSPIPVASVSVTLTSGTITSTQATQATATVRDAGGNLLTGRTIAWSSDNTAVATVSSTGVVTAVAAGSAQISATTGGQTGSATLTVIPAVAAVIVSPPSPSVVIGTTLQLAAETRDAGNNVLTGRSIAWSSSAPSIASVSPSGLVTGVALGSATITATSEGVTGTSSVTVVPVPVAFVTVSLASTSITVGQTTQATATTRDADGNILTGRSITWSSDNTVIATVSSSGVVTAIGAGSVQVIAMSEGKTGSATLTVNPPPVASVALSAPTTPVVVGGTQVLTALPKDSGGNNLSGRTVNWVSSNTAVLTVSAASSVSTSSGATVTVTAVGTGAATITATSEAAPSATTPSITVNPVPVNTVTVTPASATLIIGITPTQQLTAVTKDANDNVLTGRTVTWASSNTAAATVSTAGLVTAVGAGSTTITATSEGQNGTSSITVSLAPVATVTVSAPTTPMIQGQTQQLTATTKDANGNVLTGRTITWVSSNTAVLTVSASGSPATVTAAGLGTATITATSESVSSSPTPTITVNPVPVATVTVTPGTATLVLGISPTQQLIAVTKDANGNVLTGRVVTWASSNTAAATVNTTGLVTAVGAGSATITATSEGQNGTSSITVTVAPVATVTVSAPTTPMIVGGTQQLTATTKDANGNVLTGRAITWVSSNTAVLTVSASGSPATVTAVAVGTATITATSESVSSAPTPTITVNPVPVATVTVTPATATLVLGITPTQQLTAVTKDANGNELTGRSVTWASGNTAAASVDGNGLVTAVGAGSATITATSEGQSGTSSITVSLAPVATVTVTPATANLVLGITPTQQLTAVTKDANGNVLTGRTITWASGDPAAATVDVNGLVTAAAAGTTTVTATSEGVSGTSTITVTLAPVASVTVSAPTTPMVVGGTQQLTAVTKDANDNVLTGRTITWASSNSSVLIVSASGSPATVTGVAVGTATITATSESVSSSPTPPITVNPAPVATVTVSAPTTPMLLGASQQLTATLKDANNNTLTGRTVSWVSSNTAVLTVNPTSGTTGSTTVTSVGAGTATITATSESVSSSPTPTITVTSTTAATLLHVSSRNPRYFENTGGQIVYLTGSATWSTLRDNGTVDPPPAFDYTTYLDFLGNHNHNFFRLYAWEQDKWTAEISSDYWFSAGPYQRTGPGLALDGKPKSDLTQFNQAYFDRIRQRVIDAGSRGIYVSVMLFNGWSVGTKSGATGNNPWQGHPFNAANNINGINGDTNGDGLGYENQTLENSAITALQEAYVQKVIDAVGDLDNVLYEISNESETSSKDWQYHMIQFIRNYESTKPKQHPIGITPMWPGGVDSDLFASSADWISNTGNPDAPATATGAKVIITDTDHLCGVCGDVAWVWKSFAKGQNPILMDGYDGAAIGLGASDYNINDPKWEDIRKNMGWARNYALRLDLAAAVPHGDLVNSELIGYCLAKPGSQYLVYIPSAGSVNMDLSAVTGTLRVEWLNPATGAITPAGTTTGGPAVTLTAPFSGAAVLFLY